MRIERKNERCIKQKFTNTFMQIGKLTNKTKKKKIERGGSAL